MPNAAALDGSAALSRWLADRTFDALELLLDACDRSRAGAGSPLADRDDACLGRKIAEGTPEEIRANPRVIEAYLGKEELG